MRTNKIRIIVLLCMAFSYASGQDNIDSSYINDNQVAKEFDTKSLGDDKRIPKEAQQLINKGNNFILYGQRNYKNALPFYLNAYEHCPNNAGLNFIIGKSYLKTYDFIKSIEYLKKAHSLKPRISYELYFLLGRAYHMSSDLVMAIENYEEYIKGVKKKTRDSSDPETVTALKNAKKHIEECQFGIELMKNPVRVFLDNLGDSINSSYADYGPVVTADESHLFFTSRREDEKGGPFSSLDFNYYEDIYVSEAVDGKWGTASKLGNPVNTRTNDAVAGISLDGQNLFIYRDVNGGDIFISKLKGEKWSKPKRLGKSINSEGHESFAAYSYDQKVLYFASDRIRDDSGFESGFGGKDIYFCNLDKKGRCKSPKNMGTSINTPYDETCILAHPDGKTIFFSSKGHNSMGGYDIFKSVRGPNGWSKPQNMGYPINSVGNDVSFSLSANGKIGYYSSTTSNGDKDLYSITFLGEEKKGIMNTEDNLLSNLAKPIEDEVIEPPVKIRDNKLTMLKGIITDAITELPLGSTIEIYDNENNDSIVIIESNSSTGKYLISLPSGKNYGIHVKSNGYLFYSENFVVPSAADYQVIYKNIELNKMDIGSKVILKNIFFDTDKDSLRNESYAELSRLKTMLDNFPHLKIEISGHTDNVGNATYNQGLSEKRASSVINYLVREGILLERLTFLGHGYNQPIASNETSEGRQLNRRTEFKIIGKDYKPPKDKKQNKTKETSTTTSN